MSKQLLPNKPAFDFLGECSRGEFDLTAAQPFSREEGEITITGDKNQLRGLSRGSKKSLELCKNFFGKHGINCETDNIALNRNGILDAIVGAYRIIGLDSSDKVLVTTPTFGYYLQQLSNEKIGFSTIGSKKENGFLPDLIELEKAIIKDKTKVLLMCYPNNPTGAIMTKDYAEKLAEIVKRHDVFVISDEIFLMNPISESTMNHYPIAAVDGMVERSLTLCSPSKSMGHSSYRIAFCVGPKEFVKNFEILGGHTPIDQEILARDLATSPDNAKYLEESKTRYLDNTNFVKLGMHYLNSEFAKIFGEKREYVKPYLTSNVGSVMLLDFSGLRGKSYNGKEIKTGLDISKWMLDEAGVGTVPGECFLFDPEEMLVRIALGYEKELIMGAMECLGKATAKIITQKPGQKVQDADSLPLLETKKFQAKL